MNFVTSTPSPADPCLYIGGPTAGDPLPIRRTQRVTATDGGVGADGGASTAPPTHVRALFQNSQLSFVLANVDRAPSSQFVTSFDVHGGFGAQVVQDPITVEVSMPARIVLGPVDSLAQVTTGTAAPTYEVPYLFVVDQHRLGREQGGGPTRGQLLRINPLGYSVTVGTAFGLDRRAISRSSRTTTPAAASSRSSEPKARQAAGDRKLRELDAAQVRVETTCR